MFKKKRLSKISLLHYYKLIFRSALFLIVAAFYLYDRLHNTNGRMLNIFTRHPVLTLLIWLIFAVEMILRFFPSNVESMGCQKQFARNYRPTAPDAVPPSDKYATLAAAGAWCTLNIFIGILYYTQIIDRGILLLIALAYSVCDMICILYFCPFQTWFLKNKCCGTCRIYNWDYAMMFTPLLFIPGWFTWSLAGLGLCLLLKWELTHYRHPERFYEQTNDCLSCANCREKLCAHKKQLHRFHRKLLDRVPNLPLPNSSDSHHKKEAP
ncbi:MAG: hypothetical protein KBS74_08455 [Clostridiales bacterium]|nr:hypothetical protein [Candidatus Cacconaster stercorequi]